MLNFIKNILLRINFIKLRAKLRTNFKLEINIKQLEIKFKEDFHRRVICSTFGITIRRSTEFCQ
jgi:hypothetical protein